MRLYHNTTQNAATQILSGGFRDSRGDSFFATGVWLSDSSDARDRAMRGRSEGVMLAVDVPADLAQRFLVADFPRGGVSSASLQTSSTVCQLGARDRLVSVSLANRSQPRAQSGGR